MARLHLCARLHRAAPQSASAGRRRGRRILRPPPRRFCNQHRHKRRRRHRPRASKLRRRRLRHDGGAGRRSAGGAPFPARAAAGARRRRVGRSRALSRRRRRVCVGAESWFAGSHSRQLLARQHALPAARPAVGPPVCQLLCRRPPRVRWNRSPLGVWLEGDAWRVRRRRWRGRLADAAGRADRGFVFAAALPLPGAAARALAAAARHSNARLPHGHAQCCGGSASARPAPRAAAGPPQPLHNHRSRAGNVSPPLLRARAWHVGRVPHRTRRHPARQAPPLTAGCARPRRARPGALRHRPRRRSALSERRARGVPVRRADDEPRRRVQRRPAHRCPCAGARAACRVGTGRLTLSS
mmetsp:Transcript_20257/g.61775  ORF Transcript_20257/g.61775 Transcript_20257/m.61775 type:complete len:355 (-) Transcript_20257:15-1079(-)